MAHAWHWIDDSYPANAVNLRSVADGNFRGRRSHRWQADHHCRGRLLAGRADACTRARSTWCSRCPGRSRSSIGWDARPMSRAPMSTTTPTPSTTPSSSRWPSSGRRIRRGRGAARRSACGAAGHRLQEDPLLQPREHRLRPGEPAGSGTADHFGLVALSPLAHRSRLPVALRGARWFLGAAYALHTVATLLSMCEPRDLGKAVGSGDNDWSAQVSSKGRGEMRSAKGEVLDVDAWPSLRQRCICTTTIPAASACRGRCSSVATSCFRGHRSGVRVVAVGRVVPLASGRSWPATSSARPRAARCGCCIAAGAGGRMPVRSGELAGISSARLALSRCAMWICAPDWGNCEGRQPPVAPAAGCGVERAAGATAPAGSRALRARAQDA
jgi:hypothetical protein